MLHVRQNRFCKQTKEKAHTYTKKVPLAVQRLVTVAAPLKGQQYALFTPKRFTVVPKVYFAQSNA